MGGDTTSLTHYLTSTYYTMYTHVVIWNRFPYSSALPSRRVPGPAYTTVTILLKSRIPLELLSFESGIVSV